MTKESEKNQDSEPQDIAEIARDTKYSSSHSANPLPVSEQQKEFEKIKKELDKLKNFIVKKFPFTQSISLLPQQAVKLFVEEEEVPKETDTPTFHHLYMIVPEEKLKEIPKIKEEIVKEVQKSTHKIWVQVKTPVDVWETCLDSKFELADAIGMSLPLHDTGILGALRVAQIHKSLVLRKFERYVVSYVVAGSLTRGEAVPTSDVDVFIVINDTDVKRMPRLELKERLRGIIYQYIAEATAIAGVKNKLEPQVYLLTDFWESVKDAHPVIFTFIRDGIPLYDRGTFMPWKALLKMGKLKPSPEAIDMFMSMGDKTVKRAKSALLDILVHDIYWGVLTPSQAIIMLYGLPPPTPKQTVKQMEEIFVTKEKMLEKKYVATLARIVGIYKDFEHEKIKELKGVEIDKLLKETEEYLARLKELRTQIEKRALEETLNSISKEVYSLLKIVLGNKSNKELVEQFKKQLVAKGIFTERDVRVLSEIEDVQKEFKKGKTTPHHVDEVRKRVALLIAGLSEYAQRKELLEFAKVRWVIKYQHGLEEKFAELILTEKGSFVIERGSITLLETNEAKTPEELASAIENSKGKQISVDPKTLELLKKRFGTYQLILG